MPYKIEIQNFSGPLDLLLQLIDQQELVITEVSISQVTDQYLSYIEKMTNKDPEELSDFLVVAARLLWLKSKALLPVIGEPEEEVDDLARQLKLYKEFVDASHKIEALIGQKRFSFTRVKAPIKKEVEFAPPPGLKASDLRQTWEQILKRLEPLWRIPKATLYKAVSLQQKVLELRDFLAGQSKFGFHAFLKQAKNKGEVIVNFLALLELVKREVCQVKQRGAFKDILLEKI